MIRDHDHDHARYQSIAFGKPTKWAFKETDADDGEEEASSKRVVPVESNTGGHHSIFRQLAYRHLGPTWGVTADEQTEPN